MPSYLINIGLENGKNNLDKIAKNYIFLIRNAFGCAELSDLPLKKRILEIRKIENYSNVMSIESELIDYYPKQIYGLMVGDEGWRFVPREFARSRIKDRWGSREFVSVIVHENSIILFNNKNGSSEKPYSKSQQNLRKLFDVEIEGYFDFNYNIAGMDHGPFLCLEQALLTKFILNNQLDQINVLRNEEMHVVSYSKYFIIYKAISFWGTAKRLNMLYIEKNKLKEQLNEVKSQNKMWEIDQLSSIINKSFLINNDIRHIENELNYIESYLTLNYSIQNNQIMIFLALMGLFFALFQVIRSYVFNSSE